MTELVTARGAIARMGAVLGPGALAAVYDLYRAEQDCVAAAQPAAAADLAYGEHPRQRLDLYAPPAVSAPLPVLLWVHGGGFVRGEKRSPDHPFNAHVGRWAARHGMLGAVMNYRLAPEATWPAGGEDVAAAVAWLSAHSAAYGGDPTRIIAMGTSAGSTHIATAIGLTPDIPLCAAVLLSGLYGFTLLDARDTAYYGSTDAYPERSPRKAMIATDVPLMLVCAEYDTPRFQAETLGLLAARLDRYDRMDRAYIASGHNHFSLPYHLGGQDERLGSEILRFIGDRAGLAIVDLP